MSHLRRRHIVELEPSLPLEGRTYVSQFSRLIDMHGLAALLAAITLFAQPIIINAATRVTRAPREKINFNASGRIAPEPRYSCMAGGVKKSKESDEGLKQAIKEALDILEKCPTCRQFYGRVDPIKKLNELNGMGKIVMTENYPDDFKPIGDNWRVSHLSDFGKWEVAVTVDMYPPRRTPEFHEPCIYVNASGFVGRDDAPRTMPYDDISLRRARGFAILHELGHIVAAIPSDGPKYEGDWRRMWTSVENTLCIRMVCDPCANSLKPCKRKPAPAEFIKAVREATAERMRDERRVTKRTRARRRHS